MLLEGDEVVTKQEKKALRLQICRILDTECATCEKKQQILDGAKGSARDNMLPSLQRYCNTECLIGLKLQEFASELIGEKIKPIRKQVGAGKKKKVQVVADTAPRSRDELTPESYMEYSRKGLKDSEIARKHGLTASGMYSLKLRWRNKGLLEVET